ncbi:glutamate racemase [Helicobacter didelphidarum]|uniref:Glutamate racemase n=1 Tax=Helicobacter didelphidarum TaxID=2040648 RepID=A0A3D8IN62_9HELI|nr:glutamate racemase [Helicobacter didelphidarum]RDU66689.1 glutamate racemase [Helicobacter didelphidarum]
MNRITKIGIFDSGVGGLTVLKSLIEEIGFEKIIYYGDTARVPYGNKDQETIIRFSLEALEFFKHFNPDLLIVACNTASAHALKAMRECSHIPIVGVIESGVQALRQRNISYEKQILVLGTEATIKSGVYDTSLRELGYTNVVNIPTNLFVSLVEENIFDGEVVEATFRYYFPPTLKPSAVILGCTHFPLLLESLQRFFGSDTLFIHSGEAIANFLQQHYHNKILQKTHNTTKSDIEFFASDNINKLKQTARNWLKNDSYYSK